MALLAVSLVRDAEGQPLYFISQVEDISGLKRSEAENNRLVERITLANQVGGVGIWEWVMSQEHFTWDQRMFELYDLNPDQTPTLALWRTLLVPEDRERTDRELAALLADPKPFVMEFRITTRGGKLRHIRGQGNVILDDQDRPLRMIGTNIDMTELKILAEALHMTSHVADSQHVRLAARPGDRYAHRRRGAPDQRQRRPGNRKPHAIPAARAGGLRAGAAQPRRTLFRRATVGLTAENARWRNHGRGDGAAGRHRLARTDEKLSYSASHDALTGLPNRTRFEKQLKAAIAAGGEPSSSHSLVFLDLDRFKAVNDTAGHAAGDACCETSPS